jgi:hypothetical protein
MEEKVNKTWRINTSNEDNEENKKKRKAFLAEWKHVSIEQARVQAAKPLKNIGMAGMFYFEIRCILSPRLQHSRLVLDEVE